MSHVLLPLVLSQSYLWDEKLGALGILIKVFLLALFWYTCLCEMLTSCFYVWNSLLPNSFAFQPFKTQLYKLKNESFNIPNVTIVTPQLTQSVVSFATSGLKSVNFSQYFAEVSTRHVFFIKIITVSFTMLISTLIQSLVVDWAQDTNCQCELKKQKTSMYISKNNIMGRGLKSSYMY